MTPRAVARSEPAPLRTEAPQVVEIEVNRRCNRTCSYCPQALDWYRGPETRIDPRLYSRILNELAAQDFTGRLSFHHYNEPLLHKGLPGLVREARANLPRAFLVLYTNGDLLTDARHEALLAAGVDRFFVTRHAGTPIPARDCQVVRYPGAFVLSSRGGLVGATGGARTLPCYAPSEMLIVRHTGEVVLCHEDAMAEQVMGNLTTQSVREVWESPGFVRLRARLRQGDRGGACALCARCDNRLHPLPDTAI